jgi:hypothetical protein
MRTFESLKGKFFTDKNGKILKTENKSVQPHIGQTIHHVINRRSEYEIAEVGGKNLGILE